MQNVKKLLSVFARAHRPDVELLSSYLDGRLADGRARALEEHLASCASCGARLDELRRMRSLLRAMPFVETPRSFRLRSREAERPAPAMTASWLRLMPALSAAAIIVFAVLVGVDLYGGGGGSSSQNARPAAKIANAPRALSPAAGASVESSGLAPQRSATAGGAAELTAPSPGAESAERRAAEATRETKVTPVEGQPSGGGITALRWAEIAAAAAAMGAGALALWRFSRKTEA